MATFTTLRAPYQFSRRGARNRCEPSVPLRGFFYPSQGFRSKTLRGATKPSQGGPREDAARREAELEGELPPPEIVSPDARERLCLKCRRPFVSTWAGHRLCALCRFQNRAIGMPNGIAPPCRPREEVSLEE